MSLDKPFNLKTFEENVQQKINVNFDYIFQILNNYSSPSPITIPLGSESAPSLTFTGDSNTGIYSSGADTLCVTTAGTSSAIFSSEGNFGATTNYGAVVGGTFVPDFMYVKGSHRIHSRSLMLAEINDTVDLAIRRWNGSFGSPTEVLDGEFIGNIYWQPYGSDGAFDHASPHYGRICQISGQCIGNQTGSSRGGTLIFFTTPTGSMDTAERAWISPEGWLVCAGQSNNEWGGAFNAQNHFGKGSLTVFSPPSASLSTQSAIAVRKYGTQTTGVDLDYDDSTDRLSISTVVSDAKTLRMQVGGSIFCTQTTTGNGPNVQVIDTSNSTPDAYRFISFRTGSGSTERGTIDYNSGTTGVRYNTTSDARLKIGIQDASSAGETIDKIKVRKFQWKETGMTTDFGLIAQELFPLVPEAVSVGDASNEIEKVWGIDYSRLVPILIKEIQELRKKIYENN